MFLSNIFDPKIIYDQRETHWPPLVFPEAWRLGTLIVPFLVQSLFQQFLRKYACVRQAIHSFDTFYVEVSLHVYFVQ